ncbi:MAG: glycosyltransferase family 2 protein [Clostridiales bacterium]|nr:glycosyltransferase family 2 protein [Clostridiales bacterium]
MQPRVSVLIPAYNHGNYVGLTIESVLNQTFSNFELLIGDDCSCDNTKEVIKSYDDARIKAVFFEENQGTVISLNHLLGMAQGEYIAVLGSDDIWEKDKLEKQLQILENDASLAACFTYAQIIDKNSEKISASDVFPLSIFQYDNFPREKMLCDFFVSGNHLCHSSALIRTTVHNQIGQYLPQLRQLHDFDLWIKILLKHPIYIIKENLVKYRFVENTNNVSQASDTNNIRLYNEAKFVIENMFEHISDEDFIKGFGDFFINSGASSPEQIKCEKFFILWNKGLWNSSVKTLGLDFLMKNLSNKTFRECMKKEYGYSLNDLYAFTGNFAANCDSDMHKDFPIYKKENISLKNELESIYASKAWKLASLIKKFRNIFRRNH